MAKDILDLGATEAREFFLKGESYFTLDLPKYYRFTELLQKLSNEIGNQKLSDICMKNDKSKPTYPSSSEEVNYKLLNNKNGEYSWRVFQLIHPALYVSLVHSITKKENWKTITAKFKEFQNGIVECVSLPVIKSRTETR